MILILGFILYVGNFDTFWIAVIYAVSVVLMSLVILSSFGNIILASRLFLLYIVGAYPLAIKLWDDHLYFSVFEFNTQTLQVAVIMYALTLIAVPACCIGWHVGERAGRCAPAVSPRHSAPDLPYHQRVFYLCAICALLSGYLIVSSSTGTIFDSQYGSGTEGAPILGSASAIGGIALSVMFYCTLILRKKVFSFVILIVAFYLLIWCQILRGLRQDVVGVVFSCVVLYLLIEAKDMSIKLKYILCVLPFMLLLELWGLIRTGLSQFMAGEIDTDELFNMGLGNAAVMSDVVYSGTLGPIATTFSNIVYLMREGAIDVIYGQGYFDYILRTPPEFVYPGRPKDYATMFPDYGLTSGGGFFELAEAYLNFGLLGTFFVPLLITAFIAYFYSTVKWNRGIFYVFALSSILCVWLRGSWYQTFAFYKSFISAALLFLLVHGMAVILMGKWKSKQGAVRTG